MFLFFFWCDYNISKHATLENHLICQLPTEPLDRVRVAEMSFIPMFILKRYDLFQSFVTKRYDILQVKLVFCRLPGVLRLHVCNYRQDKWQSISIVLNIASLAFSVESNKVHTRNFLWYIQIYPFYLNVNHD